MVTTTEILPRGPFSLKAAAEFGFGPTEGRPPPFDGAMRLAFPLDDGSGYAGVILRQPTPDGPVQAEIETSHGGDPARPATKPRVSSRSTTMARRSPRSATATR